MYTSIWCYLRVLPVLHRPEVVDIGRYGVNTTVELQWLEQALGHEK